MKQTDENMTSTKENLFQIRSILSLSILILLRRNFVIFSDSKRVLNISA